MVKKMLPVFYQNHPDFYVTIRNHVELNSSVVDVMLKVFESATRKKLFTVNLYNTVSKALINGRSPKMFESHLKEVRSHIQDGTISDINEVVENIRRSIRSRKPSTRILEQKQTRQNSSKKNNQDKKNRRKSAHVSLQQPQKCDETGR